MPSSRTAGSEPLGNCLTQGKSVVHRVVRQGHRKLEVNKSKVTVRSTDCHCREFFDTISLGAVLLGWPLTSVPPPTCCPLVQARSILSQAYILHSPLSSLLSSWQPGPAMLENNNRFSLPCSSLPCTFNQECYPQLLPRPHLDFLFVAIIPF